MRMRACVCVRACGVWGCLGGCGVGGVDVGWVGWVWARPMSVYALSLFNSYLILWRKTLPFARGSFLLSCLFIDSDPKTDDSNHG